MPQLRPWPARAYLGDGVYVEHEGYQLWLKTERESGWHVIALEPGVFAALVAYERELRVRYASPLDEAVDGGGPLES